MLPKQKKKIQEKLLLWGYPPYIVELMEPWSLLSHYNYELKKREQLLLAGQNEGTDNFEIERTVELEKKPEEKYKGVKVPYRW